MSEQENNIEEPLIAKEKDQAANQEDERANLGFLDVFLSLFNGMKYLVILAALTYGYVYSGSKRTEQIEVIHELSRERLLDITYHHDTIFANNSYSTNMSDEEKRRLKSWQGVSNQEEGIKKRAIESGEIAKV